MKYLIFAFVAIMLSCTSCDNNSTDDYTWYFYNETQCADPWQTGIGSPTQDIETAVGNYLDGLDINYDAINVDTSGTPEICLACSCLSGRIINVKADPANNVELIGINFVQQ